jgi:hypothetical protein
VSVSAKTAVSGAQPRGEWLFPAKLIPIAVFLSAVSFFIPLQSGDRPPGFRGVMEVVLISVHNAMRMFVLDGEFDTVKHATALFPPPYGGAYSAWAAVLYVAAPVMTFGFVMSFFVNVSAFAKYLLSYFQPAYVFSELNGRSLTLAKSISSKFGRAPIVFADISRRDGGLSDGLYAEAKSLGAICFRDNILNISRRPHGGSAQMCYFCIGGDETENCNDILSLIRSGRVRGNDRYYLFSTSPDSGALTNSAYGASDGRVELRLFHFDEVRQLILNTLYNESIFAKAIPSGDNKLISAVVVGIGRCGSEMIRGLCWCGQMFGYELEIHAFDRDSEAVSRFIAQCPELVSHSGEKTPGEARYTLDLHGGVDYRSLEFTAVIEGLRAATFVFVAMGEDERNLSAALDLRTLLERCGHFPDILAVVYNSKKANLIRENHLTNFKNQPWDIKIVGDLETLYSFESVMRSELERTALMIHKVWGDENLFWRYDYNYRSSAASAIHSKWTREVGNDRLPLDVLARQEHLRWNAYMRGIGYRYGKTRNDRAMLHNLLIPWDELSEEEQRKDYAVLLPFVKSEDIPLSSGSVAEPDR